MSGSTNSAVWLRLLSFLNYFLPRRLRSSKSALIISMPRFRMFRKKYITRKQRRRLLPQHGLQLVWARREHTSLKSKNPLTAYLRKVKQMHQRREWLTVTGTEKKDTFPVHLKH